MLATMPMIMQAHPSADSRKPRPPIILEKNNSNGQTKRPQAPDRQMVTCSYDGTGLMLTLKIPEGIATFTVSDEKMNDWTYTIDTSEIEIYVNIEPLSGNITLQLDTERDNHFFGILYE